MLTRQEIRVIPANRAAAAIGIELEWSGEAQRECATVGAVLDPEIKLTAGDVIIRIDPHYYRAAEVDSLLGDASRARQELDWSPRISFDELVREMALHDFRLAREDALILDSRKEH